jgi:adenine phosphoribosyltransferase
LQPVFGHRLSLVRFLINVDLGGSAKAAGELVKQLGGKTLEYLFVIELLFLKGRDKLDAPVYSIVESND